MTVADFFNAYADCRHVPWCNRTPAQHDGQDHQGVLCSALGVAPRWRGEQTVTLQAVMTGPWADSPKLGFTLIPSAALGLPQVSTILTDAQLDKLEAAIREYRQWKRDLRHG